jgi:site-specific recombinase XerD
VQKSEFESISNPQSLPFERILNVLLKNVATSTRRIYLGDARQFAKWLTEHNFSLPTVDFEQLSDYRAYLDKFYHHKPTAERKLVVVRRLLEVAIILKLRIDNPARDLAGFTTGSENETPHRALNKAEVKTLLEAIPTATNKGKRDYALIMLLLRTGIRRAEATALLRSDLVSEQGHMIATIQHGKGEKRRIIKLPVDVYRAINQYLEAVETDLADTPLFVRFTKGDHPYPELPALSGLAIERIVEGYAQAANLTGLTPHGLRATFVTITLENGATLEQVQYAVGHADPRTTERYQKRKLNLENNAVDYFRL